MANIKYFGAIAEATQCHEEEIVVSNLKLTDVVALLNKKYNLKALEVKVVLNQNLIQPDSNRIIKDSDELALLSSFSGG